MSLTSALNSARSALFNTARQTGIISRNVSEASNPNYARRDAVYASTAHGARITEIRRATNDVLFRQNLFATASWSGQSTISTGLDTLRVTVNGVENATSAATTIGKLQEAMQLFSATPSNRTLAENAVEAARQVVRSLNEGTDAIQTFRADADKEIATAVDDLNRLLGDFEMVNNEVVAGTRVKRDVSDALDRRDGLLKQISEYVSISTTTRSDNDLVIMTGDGSTLFETVPRAVTFDAEATYTAGMTGNKVLIDGVPLQQGAGGNTSANGLIAANLQLRDDTAAKMQSQLDEVARGLITTFSETDPSGGLPDLAGLFTVDDPAIIITPGTLTSGLAGAIRINAAMDPAAGGDAFLLRDGGANGAAYVHNATGASSFSDLLLSYAERLEAPISFDPVTGLNTSRSVGDFASDSIGWLEGQRQDAARGAESKAALITRTTTALSSATSVNVDEEMSQLLDLEHAYEASARLLSVIDEMLATLMQAAR